MLQLRSIFFYETKLTFYCNFNMKDSDGAMAIEALPSPLILLVLFCIYHTIDLQEYTSHL